MVKKTRRSRADKVIEGVLPQSKEKFLAVARQEEFIAPKFEAKTVRQKLALAILREGRSVNIFRGSAGTGKSMIAAYHAATLLKQKKVDKIYLVRPAVPTGKSIGLLPGTEAEKLAPYFAQTVVHLEKFLGKGATAYNLEKGVIEMKAVEYLRGTSFENCVVIFEEAQNFTNDQMEMTLTRLGENAVFIFTGDTKQSDLHGECGLSTTIDLINKTLRNQPDYMQDEDLNMLEDLIGIVEFLPEDVVRHGLTKAFVKMYYNN